MNYRRLGRTGYRVSVLGIGTCQLRRVPENQAIETLIRAFELGVNLVNLAPDYEGADDLVAQALKELDPGRKIYLSIQCCGDAAFFERYFEESCERFHTSRLDMYGIAAISDHEAYGMVWGKGGMVDFLQRKKEEGRLGAIFGSDHGSPEHLKELLKRDIFDVMMLAYNPLGFHLGTFRADTVWEIIAPPAPLVGDYELEDLPRTGREILPLAREKDIGILLMKPLGGGLLCDSRAFPPWPYEGRQAGLTAGEVLRYQLVNEAVACVVPGMASVAEVEENAHAAAQEILLTPMEIREIESRVTRLSRVLCSRCGHCDERCSKGVPLSFLFRAAYLYLYPSVPFEASPGLRYLDLHPWEECMCENCMEKTCVCPQGIDIPNQLKAIHREMRRMACAGLLPGQDKGQEDWQSGRPFDFKVLAREIPATLPPGGQSTVRLHLRNIGEKAWHAKPGADRTPVCLAVYTGNRRAQTVRLRHDVPPHADCHFAFVVRAPRKPGRHALRFELCRLSGKRPGALLAAPIQSETRVPGDEGPPAAAAHAKGSRYYGARLIRHAGAMTSDRENETRHCERFSTKSVLRVTRPQGAKPFSPGAWYRWADEAARQLAHRIVNRAPRLKKPAVFVRNLWRAKLAQSSPQPSTRSEKRYSGGNTGYAAVLLEHTLPARAAAGSTRTFRAHLQNAGSKAWSTDPEMNSLASVGLYLEDSLLAAGYPIAHTVSAGQGTLVAFTVTFPEKTGDYELRLDVLCRGSVITRNTLYQTVTLYARKKDQTEELLGIARKRNPWFFSPGQSVHLSGDEPVYPVFADSALGCWVTDVDGKKFLDLLMGWGCCVLGHADERVQSAIRQSLASSGMASLPHRLQIEAAEALCRRFPSCQSVLWGKNGSDATTAAIRSARAFTGRKAVVWAGYHGWQDWCVAGHGFGATGVPETAAAHGQRVPYRDLEALKAAAKVHAKDLAAIMIEPAHMVLDFDDPNHEADGGYLSAAEDLARRYGALFILDEIMTGFRFRTGSAQKAFGLTPDLTCLGKALSNGQPLSALLGRNDILHQVNHRIHFNPTFTGEVHSFAAALAVLKIHGEEDVPGELWNRGERLRGHVNDICRDLGVNARLVGPPYRMYLAMPGIADGEQLRLSRTLLQQELARHGVISHQGFVITSIRHDEEAVAFCGRAFRASLRVLRDAWQAPSMIRYLDIPDVGPP